MSELLYPTLNSRPIHLVVMYTTIQKLGVKKNFFFTSPKLHLFDTFCGQETFIIINVDMSCAAFSENLDIYFFSMSLDEYKVQNIFF